MRREFERIKGRFETKKSSLEKEEAIPDTLEEDLAAVEEKRQDKAMERVELAIKMEVISIPEFTDIVLYQRCTSVGRQSCCGANQINSS